MDFELAELLPGAVDLLMLTAILSFGIFVQSAAGFAAGLITIPALLWCGFSIPEAQVSLLVATIPQNIWGVYRFRGQVGWREVAWPGVLRIGWLPVGMAALVSLESLAMETIRQVVGGVLLTITLAIMLFRPLPRERLHRAWGGLAFSCSGFLQGLVGMGGPAMVLWVQAHDWDTKRSRGFLFTMYLISLLPAFICLGLYFGSRVLVPGLTAGLLIPWLLWVTSLGLTAGTWLGRGRLRRLTLWLLLIMGLAGLCAPWLTRAAPREAINGNSEAVSGNGEAISSISEAAKFITSSRC